jgi:branched-chain amino acid transport system ATP-binding protein
MSVDHSQTLLSVDTVSKSFGAVQAVKDVSFQVHAGEILGIIGPNGSGKTTLFNCILGQLRPDHSQVSFKGTDISGWSPVRVSRAGLGRTFQLLQVFSTMTVRDNLIAAAQELDGTVLQRLFRSPDLGLGPTVDEALSSFRLAHLADAKAGDLSYGQQKLLDIAMALMSGPEIIFLDEPAGGVNPTMLTDVRDLILDLNRSRETTFVVIEHNMEFIMEVAHRILVLAEGQVLMVGSPEEVRNDPRVIEAYLGD